MFDCTHDVGQRVDVDKVLQPSGEGAGRNEGAREEPWRASPWAIARQKAHHLGHHLEMIEDPLVHVLA